MTLTILLAAIAAIGGILWPLTDMIRGIVRQTALLKGDLRFLASARLEHTRALTLRADATARLLEAVELANTLSQLSQAAQLSLGATADLATRSKGARETLTLELSKLGAQGGHVRLDSDDLAAAEVLEEAIQRLARAGVQLQLPAAASSSAPDAISPSVSP